MENKTALTPVVKLNAMPKLTINQTRTTKKTNTVTKLKKSHSKMIHPRTSDMVNAAIKMLKERSGSSLQAIKKYIASTYKLDAGKNAPFIKRYLKAAVISGILVQTKGKGASGSFKLSNSKLDVPKAIKVQRNLPKIAGIKRSIMGKKLTSDKKVIKKPVAIKNLKIAKISSIKLSKRKAAPKSKIIKVPSKKLKVLKSQKNLSNKRSKSTPRKTIVLQK